MNAPTEQVDDLQLVALPSAVSCADMFVRFTLGEWSLRGLQDDATLLARHLVESAVERNDPDAPGMMTVRLRLSGSDLVIEVETAPSARPPGDAGAHVGVARLPGGGYVTWCTVELPSGMNASAVPLPRREKRRSPEAERLKDVPDEFDPQVMERILYGLNKRKPT